MDLAGIMELVGQVGQVDAGQPIQVALVPETSELARQVEPWIVGFARGASGGIVIFPARSPQYPHISLDDVLRHEVAHVLIARASDGQFVPRWFNEGLAIAAERSWRFEDQTRLLYHLVLGPAPDPAGIERLFAGGQSSQNRAYALSGAFVRDLLEQHGDDTPGEIFARMRDGMSFDRAFAQTVGQTPNEAVSHFLQRQRIWTTWVPIITSSAAVWTVVTIIALAAIRRRRQMDAALRTKWDDQDGESPDV
jgi:hypothetical protein